MRKLIVLSFMTMDGVVQAPGGPEEDPSGGFRYGGWTVFYWDDILGAVIDEQMARPFDLLLGRKTYEIFASYWPYVKGADPTAERLNSARKYVASRTLEKLDWNNSLLIRGDVVEEVRKLKQEDGPPLHILGSSNLIQTLLKHDLIDEFQLEIFPLTLGRGKRLFGEGTIQAAFRLVDSKTSSKGVIVATYERAGDVRTGSFDQEVPAQEELARSTKG